MKSRARTRISAAAIALGIALAAAIGARADDNPKSHEVDVERAPVGVRELARSVCAIVYRKAVVKEGKEYRLLLDNGRLPIHGTGFLVAPNVVATSLHVVGASVDSLALVFDFISQNGRTPERIDGDHVRDELLLNSDVRSIAPGFAFLCLEDSVTDRTPLVISPHFVQERDTVFAIGHPAGLTMKYFPPARVICSYYECPIFTVLDVGTTSGNSGSPLFLSSQHEDRRVFEVVGAVNAGYTGVLLDPCYDCYSCERPQVTGVRAAKLSEALMASEPASCRMRPSPKQ